MTVFYITIEQLINTHGLTIEKSGGGDQGHLNVGQLDSVLEHIKNDDYYPSFQDKLIHLFWACCKFHCFCDGNKRIALVASTQFLLINGYMFIVKDFIRRMENISYQVAAGKIDKTLLEEIINSLFDNTFDSEDIKLKIFCAIS